LFRGSLGHDGSFGLERRGVGPDSALISGRPDQIGRDNRMFAEGMRVAALTNSLPAVRLSSHMSDASSQGVSGERDVRGASRKVPDDP
jgi:hypothetical protein